MSKKIETAILVVLLTLNSLAFAAEVNPNADVELSSEEALVKVFEDTYKKFALECVDAEAKEIAPSVLIEGKLEECQTKAREVERLYNQTKAKISDLDNIQISLAQCQKEGGYRTIEELIGSVADVSSRVSCQKEEQRSCMNDLGCNVVRSLDGMIRGGGYLLSKLSDKIQNKLVDSGMAKKSCFDQSNGNCLDELIGAFIGNLVSTGESLWTVAKSIWGFFSSGTKMINTTSNNLHTAVTTSVKGVINFGTHPIDWIMQKAQSMMTGVKTWMKSEVFCQKWEGRPHASTCEQPMDSFDCLDCNDSMNAICAAGGFAVAEIGIMALTGGAGAVVSVGTKLAIKGAAVSAAKMSAMSARAMAKVESIVPEIKMLKKRNAEKERDAKSKMKAFEMAQGAIKAFQNIDIHKMKESVSLFSKEKIALARAKSKTFDTVAQATVTGTKAAIKAATVAKDAVGKVKGVSDNVLEKAYSVGGRSTEYVMEKVTGGRLRVTHYGGSTKTVAVTNGGIVVNNALGTKVTGTSARIVAAGRLPSSVRRNVKEVSSDKFNVEKFQEHITPKTTHQPTSNQRKPGESPFENHAQNQGNGQNNGQNNDGNGTFTGRAGPMGGRVVEGLMISGGNSVGKNLINSNIGKLSNAKRVAVRGGIEEAKRRRGSLLTAVSAGGGFLKALKSNQEVENDRFGKNLSLAQKNQMTKIAVDKVIKTTDSVSFDRLGDDEKSIHKASQILGADANQLLNDKNLEKRFFEQQTIFSDENKENFTKEYAQKTGVSEDVAKDVFETRQKELSAAKEYLQSYSKTVADSIANSSRNYSQPVNNNSAKVFDIESSKTKDLENKISQMESSIKDLSSESDILEKQEKVKKGEVVKKEAIAQKKSEKRAPASTSSKTIKNASAPTFSSASFNSGTSSSASDYAAPSGSQQALDVTSANQVESVKAVAKTEQVEESPKVVSVLNNDEQKKARTSRAQTLSELLSVGDKKLKVHQNEELPWSLAEIVKNVSDKEDKAKLTALIAKKAKYKKMEEFDGGSFKLHIIEFLSGDKMSVKVQGQSMEIIEMNSALKLKDQILAK